jgi:ABC-type multidrug transport system fused ATPase/permease subunit
VFRGFEVATLAISCVSAHIVSVAQLLLILIFIFSNIGVALFGDFSSTGSRYAKFENELSSMQLLFVLMTGEAWTDFMEAMVQSNENSYLRIVLTFVIFLTLSKLILENLFVMVCFLKLIMIFAALLSIQFGYYISSCVFLLNQTRNIVCYFADVRVNNTNIFSGFRWCANLLTS